MDDRSRFQDKYRDSRTPIADKSGTRQRRGGGRGALELAGAGDSVV